MIGADADTDPAERWHPLDAPFMPYDEWIDQLEEGTCTRCGQPAERGMTRWWHLGRDCRTAPRQQGAPHLARFRGN